MTDAAEAAFLASEAARLCDLCDFDPRTYTGRAIGMFHCPACGCMIVAAIAHPPCDPTECWLGSENGMDLGDPGPG